MVATRSLARRRSVPFILVALAVSVLLAGCGGDSGDNTAPTTTTLRPTTTTSSSTTTSATAPGEEAAVRAAYDAASRAFIDAAAIPDPNSPAIAATHTGPMLEQRRDTLRALQRDHRIIRYPQPSQYRIEVESVDVEGDVARLVVCVVDDGERVEQDTGRVIASGVGTVRGTAAMRRVDGTWRLAERREDQRWDGVAGCAVD